MKKLKVKAKQQIKAIINFNINQIRMDNCALAKCRKLLKGGE